MSFVRRAGAVVVVTLGLLWVGVGAAQAHVTVDSPGAAEGGYAVLTFRVPTESATASTTGLQVQLPADSPLAEVSVEPMPGWTYHVTTATLATPITTDDGPVDQAVSEIDWTATGTGIKPGEFQEFRISAGPLPNKPSITFKAIQHYSDKSTVSWVEVAGAGSAEPEHPAPTLTLATAGTASAPAAPAATTMDMAAVTTTSKGTSSMTVAALVLGAIGMVLGAGGLGLGLAARRREQA